MWCGHHLQHHTHQWSTLRLCLWGGQGCPTLVHVPRNSAYLPLQPCPRCHSVSVPPQTPMPPQHPIITQSLTSLHSPAECLALFLHSQEGGPQSWMKCYPVYMLPYSIQWSKKPFDNYRCSISEMHRVNITDRKVIIQNIVWVYIFLIFTAIFYYLSIQESVPFNTVPSESLI